MFIGIGLLTVALFLDAMSNDVCVAFCVSVSGAQQTLKTTFMLFVEHLPPIRLCRSSLEDVAINGFMVKQKNQRSSREKEKEKKRVTVSKNQT